MNGAYHQILATRALGAFQHITTSVGNSDEGVRDVILDAGNDGVGVRDIMRNSRNGCIYIYYKCSLVGGVNNGHHSSDRTHVKDLKNPVEVQPPGGDRRFILLRVEMPKDHVSFIPLHELLLNICCGTATERIRMDSLRYMSLVQLTLRVDLSHHTRTD